MESLITRWPRKEVNWFVGISAHEASPSLPTLQFPSDPFSLYRLAHIVFASECCHVTTTANICVKRRVWTTGGEYTVGGTL